MPWEHQVVRGTLMRKKYVNPDAKQLYRKEGLSERFYVATKINGSMEEVKVALLAEPDAKRIFEDAKAKDGKYPEQGIPVDAQIIRYSRLRERDRERKYGYPSSETYYAATSLNEDVISTPDAPSW